MVDDRVQDELAARRARRRGPPDYSSRGVQFRLLVLVFLVMTVLVMMREARKPETWRWMWRFEHSTLPDEGAELEGVVDGGGPAAVDTRPVAQAVADDPSSEPVITVPDSRVAWRELLDESLGESLVAAQLQGWTQVLDAVGQPLRDRLQVGLWHYRHGQPFPAGLGRQWPGLLAELGRQWERYAARADQALESDQLAPEQCELGRSVLTALRVAVERQLAALGALGDRIVVPDDLAAALDQLQRVLDARAWRAVTDNTVFRSAEREAWLRAWETLASRGGADQSLEASPVSHVQLFSQPEAYRGRLVRVRGTVRRGYRVAAREPQLGIEDYHVLWLREAGGGNAPIVAYVAALPAEFPPLAALGPGQGGTPLREEVTITGVFFKRWLHSSGDGSSLTPLILGRITRWTPPGPTSARSGLARLDAMAVLCTLLSVAVVALLLAGWVCRSSRWARRELPESARPPSELPPFDLLSVRPSVQESLRRMTQEETRDEAQGTQARRNAP